MSNLLTLFSYWRSSAAYRVRIALAIKELEYQVKPIHLVNGGGEQHAPEYHAINPQELVPTLMHGDHVITQSVAIIEYLDEMFSTAPALMPQDYLARAQVRAFALAIACEIHPLINRRTQIYLQNDLNLSDTQNQTWVRHWIKETLTVLEAQVQQPNADGSAFCVGDTVSMAECVLIPQLYSARRFGVDLTPFPKLVAIDDFCATLHAFQIAHPDAQIDAPAKT